MAGNLGNTHSAAQLSSRTRWVWFLILFAGLLALPLVAPRYWIFFVCLFGINIVATHGLNIMMGYTGLLSLGHAAFIGVGAYTACLLQIHFGLAFYITIPLAGVSAAVIGVGFGLPSLRIRGLYLVVATLAAQFILNFVFVHWQSLTNGDVGLTVKPAEIFGYALNNETRFYYLIVPVAALMTYMAYNLIRSRTGRAFIAIRERDLTADVLGVEIVWYKLVSFAVGSFYAGVAGGLLAYFNRYVTPEQFGLMVSVFFLSAIIVGGMGSILGAILGALFMTILPEVLRESVLLFGTTFDFNTAILLVPIQETIFGLLLVSFLIFEPRGLARIWARAQHWFYRLLSKS
jgi:branched-chain amino acid transport system permease protein